MKKPSLSRRRVRPKKPSGAVAASAEPVSAPSEAFPIVGVGASAGGLEALEQFLKHVPVDSGCAFVIVQHLDPTRDGVMVELLQRDTPMQIVEVKDGTRVRPDCVYMIPPNRDMSLLMGVLHLFEPSGPRGLRLPIDFFFRSLAEDQHERSVGIILSGMGSDGTLGLREIKAQAGVVLVQAPGSAKFDAMPRSAINAGLADIVAPVAELPARLLEYLRHAPRSAPRGRLDAEISSTQLEKIVVLLRAQSGNDFSLYKPNTICRRIERRMALHKITKITAYVRYLQENSQELDLLFKELLIGVTGFFRDPNVWAQMKDEVFPGMLAGRPAGRGLRAWVAGCSTGEEAYSLAIVFKEALEQMKPRTNVALQIFATDLNRDAVERARQGFYPENIAADVTPERLDRFFTKEKHGYRVAKEIREMVIFAPQNLIVDPPFTKLDVMSCRNLLIYFAPELQTRLHPLFHYSLKPDGVLMLGSAESVSGFTGLFTPLPGKSRLFRRREARTRAGMLVFPPVQPSAPLDAPSGWSAPVPTGAGLQASAEQWLLQHRTPAAVLVNEVGDILFVSGRTGRYLEPAAGKANWNLFVMARESLRYELTGAFQRARRLPGAALCRGALVAGDGRVQSVDVSVQFLKEPAALRGLAMIVFAEPLNPEAKKARVAQPAGAGRRVRELAEELQRALADAHSARAERQTSDDELKSINEEIQSTNEELQSTNEELTTSKEEMQSLNEELQTVNAELQAKVEELSAASNDMKNLLNSTEIATVFLDNALCVRRFTEQATKLFKFIPGDVGRPVTDLASDLVYPEMAADAQETLRTLVPREKSVVTRAGRWFAMRLMPYRTTENRIEGVVLTFMDITIAKVLEAELRMRKAGGS